MDQLVDLMSICSCMWIFGWNTCLKEVTSYLVLIWLWNYDIYYRYIVTTCITCTSTAHCLHYTCAATMQTLPGCFGFAVESTPCLFRLYPRVATRSEISISESFPCYGWCIGSSSIMPKTLKTQEQCSELEWDFWFVLGFHLRSLSFVPAIDNFNQQFLESSFESFTFWSSLGSSPPWRSVRPQEMRGLEIRWKQSLDKRRREEEEDSWTYQDSKTAHQMRYTMTLWCQ